MLRASTCQGNDNRNLVKSNSHFICLACETRHDDYACFCHACGGEETISPIDDAELDELEEEQQKPRKKAKRALLISTTMPPVISTGRPAWDHALGGGFVRPSSILIPGEMGVGKSTSSLRVADYIGNVLKRPVLYGSAEMPEQHIRGLCNKLGLSMKHLWINDSGSAEDMHDDIAELKPALVVWDSIQRFHVNGELGPTEIKKVIRGAIDSGNRVKAVTLFLSQLNKGDDFMGENSIGHDCDVVLWLKNAGPNLVSVECPIKNRFAPTPLTAIESLY